MTESKFEPRPSVLVGDTADVYLHRALAVFRAESLNPLVTVEVHSAADGVCCGIEEVKTDKFLNSHSERGAGGFGSTGDK